MKESLLPQYIFSLNPIRYQDRTILQEQDFSIPQQRWTFLTGPSGSGKTTLLKTILGLVPGLKAGKNYTPRPSYMPQRDLLLPWKTVWENLSLGPSLRQNSFCQIRAETLLKAVGLYDRRHCYPHQLSLGMRHRVALARTLMEDSDLVLMDEPFSAVDIQTRQELHRLATDQLKGKTILCVSHDWDEVVKLADQIFILEGSPAFCRRLSKKDCPKPWKKSLYA